MEAGLVALYQKCPHLGCRVPNCSSSQWFECPCRGSRAQPGRREEGRTGSSGHGPLRHGGHRWPVHREHRPGHPGAAHRHQHHRPGSRRRTLRRRRNAPLRIVAAAGIGPRHHTGTHEVQSVSRLHVAPEETHEHVDDRRSNDPTSHWFRRPRRRGGGLRHLALRQPPVGPRRGGVRDRARPEPQAVLLRRGARGKKLNLAPSPPQACSPSSAASHSRCTGSPSPVVKAGAIETYHETFVERGLNIYENTARCVACHGGSGGGGNATFIIERPERSVRLAGLLDGTGAEQRAVPLLRGGCALHPQLRPARFADGGLGRPRWWPAHHPADRQHHRLPLVGAAVAEGDPLHARRRREGHRRGALRPHARGAATRARTSCRTGRSRR